jgi:lysophospholipase L1-like esterase
MNTSSPLRVFIFVVSIAMLGVICSFLLPEEGLTVGSVELKFISNEEILNPSKPKKKDISKIIAQVNTKEQAEKPLVQHRNGSTGKHGEPSIVNYEINSSTRLHLEQKGNEKLISFFGKLESLAKERKKIHILHFGDSQIEGDRMTGFIRQRMQEKFGGYGPGLIPAKNVYSTMAFRQTCSENFQRYTCFGGAKLANKNYGVSNSAARFTSENIDTTTAKEQIAWIEVGQNRAAQGRAQNYNNVSMFYNSCKSPCLLTVYMGEKIIHEEQLNTDGKAHQVKLGFSGTPGPLKFEFKSKVSPNITAFSLEGDFGVQVDNIAMRGSSGTFFGSVDKSAFAEMLNELDVQMTIMQFGGNSIPSLYDSASVRRYASNFQSQLETLKRLKPDMAIVFIGPSDMSKLKKGEYLTYPLLPYCVEQLKKIALNSGVAYWDLYEAMGGENSMPAWVEKNLGRSDHVHFSIEGSRVAAQLFYDAFISEYIKKEQE